MGLRTGTATANLGGLGTMLGTMANPMTAVALGATAVGAALVGSVQAAASWQSSMSGVAKTTGMAGPELQTLSKELLDMSTKMPAAASEIANVAQVAGSLGIAKEGIAGFTEVAIQMGVGFEMSAEQAATSGAKILTAFSLDTTSENMRNLGNVVNKMGDDFAATETQVLDFTNRASYLSTTFGLSIPQVAAWGTALISSGVEAERAATGIKSMMNLSLDPKKFDAFAKAAGMTSEALRESLNQDVQGTYEKIAKDIAGGTDAVEKFGTISKIVGTEGMEVFNKMGTSTYQGAEAVRKANAEWENGASLTKTYEAQMATFDSQMQIFWNTVNMAGVELGTVLLPGLTKTVEVMAALAKGAVSAGQGIYGAFEGADKWIGDAAAWFDKDIFGITGEKAGEVFADGLGTGIEENADTIASDTKAALSGEEMMKASAAAAQSAADEWVSKFGDAAEKGMMFIGGKWTSESDVHKNQIDTTFKLQDQEYILRRIIAGDTTRFQLLDDQKNVIEQTGIIWENQLKNFSGMDWAKSMLAGTQTVSWDEILDPQKKAASQAKELGEKVASAMTDGIATEAEKKEMFGLARQLDDFRDKNATEWAKIGTDASNAYIDAMLAGDWGKVNDLAEKVGQDFMDSLTGALLGTKDTRSLAQVVQDILSGKETISSPKNFMENTWQPGLKKSFDEMYDIYDDGFGDDLKLAKAWIEDKEKIYTEHAEWFNKWQQSLFEMYEGGDVSVREFVDVWDKMSDTSKKTTEATKSQSTNVLDLAKSIDTAEEAMSAFGIAQEMMAADLFRSDYVGGDTESWAANYAKETQEIARTQANVARMGGVSVGKQYAYEPLVEEMDLETTKAMSAKDNLLTEIQNSNPEMTLALDTNAAYTAWGHLVQDIEAMQPVMRVDVEFSANSMQLRQMVAEILAEAAS